MYVRGGREGVDRENLVYNYHNAYKRKKYKKKGRKKRKERK